MLIHFHSLAGEAAFKFVTQKPQHLENLSRGGKLFHYQQQTIQATTKDG